MLQVRCTLALTRSWNSALEPLSQVRQCLDFLLDLQASPGMAAFPSTPLSHQAVTYTYCIRLRASLRVPTRLRSSTSSLAPQDMRKATLSAASQRTNLQAENMQEACPGLCKEPVAEAETPPSQALPPTPLHAAPRTPGHAPNYHCKCADPQLMHSPPGLCGMPWCSGGLKGPGPQAKQLRLWSPGRGRLPALQSALDKCVVLSLPRPSPAPPQAASLCRNPANWGSSCLCFIGDIVLPQRLPSHSCLSVFTFPSRAAVSFLSDFLGSGFSNPLSLPHQESTSHHPPFTSF